MVDLEPPVETAVARLLESTLESHQFERYRIYIREMLGTPGGSAWLAATPNAVTGEAIEHLDPEDVERGRILAATAMPAAETGNE